MRNKKGKKEKKSIFSTNDVLSFIYDPVQVLSGWGWGAVPNEEQGLPNKYLCQYKYIIYCPVPNSEYINISFLHITAFYAKLFFPSKLSESGTVLRRQRNKGRRRETNDYKKINQKLKIKK